jgi:hypothetical protein
MKFFRGPGSVVRPEKTRCSCRSRSEIAISTPHAQVVDESRWAFLNPVSRDLESGWRFGGGLSHRPVDPLKVLEARELDQHLAFARAHVDLDPGVEMLGEQAL